MLVGHLCQENPSLDDDMGTLLDQAIDAREQGSST